MRVWHSAGYFCVLLQAMPLVIGVEMQSKIVARNVMEGGSTERHFIHQIHLTEPQGIIKNVAGYCF